MIDIELADTATTPAALLARVRATRKMAVDAEVEILRLALAWADAHPDLDDDKSWRRTPPGVAARELDARSCTEDQADVEWCGIPPVRWDAPAAFAAANAMTTGAGQALIRDALVLRHRLPKTWTRVDSGHVPAWRARRVAQAVLGSPDDVVDAIDDHLAPVADKIGSVTLDRLIEEAMLRLHAEEREIAQLEALDARFVHLDPTSINHTGIAEMAIRADWKDLHDFDLALTQVAAALALQGNTESLDIRRAMAVGVLADPAAAHALLTGKSAPAPCKRVVLHLHLSQAAIAGHDTVGRNETTGHAVLAEQIRDWCGRTDTHLVVKPVVDLADHVQVDAYEIPDRLHEQIGLINPTCVFPWCTRRARDCDCDHITPHADGGPTCSCNLAPLCRRHHRLKTHTSWNYRPLDPVTDPGVYLWTDPHGLRYLRSPTGTIDINSDRVAQRTGPAPHGTSRAAPG